MTNSPFKITSTANPHIKELAKEKTHPSKDFFLVEGKHLVDEAFRHGCLKEVYSLEEADYPGVKVTLVSEEVLEKLAFSKTPSGIVGVAYKKDLDLPEGKTLFLDAVQDPGNVGTLLRTALAFGYHRVVLTRDSASPFSSKVIAASQGAIFALQIEVVEDPLKAIESLKQRGHVIVSGALYHALPLRELPKLREPFTLVVGNEGQGIRQKILEASTYVAKIEMEGIESLNVGVAGAILMYEL
ncbi:MAG: RNA methyltransferase [Bacilli bacterium]|nr:RNA methyltransferase [Bacilli bacterium]